MTIQVPRDPGPAGWARLLPDIAPGPTLEGRKNADFLVIGAGFAGLSAAWRLLQINPNARIAILEASQVGEGPAGRNSGFMIDLPHDLSSTAYGGGAQQDRVTIAENRVAIQFASNLANELNLGVDVFDPSGKVNGAATARGVHHNETYAAHLMELGEAHEALDAVQMRELTGSDYYRGGLFTPGTVLLQPAAWVRALAGGLRERGVEIYEKSPVQSLEPCGADWCATTPKGAITAPQVILAVNGVLERFGHQRGRLMHVFTYASMTRAFSRHEGRVLGGAARWHLTPADPLGTTVRKFPTAAGDRVVIRNTFTFDPGMEVAPRKLRRICAAHDSALAARFPHLGDTSMEYRWAGRLCLSINGVQAVDEVESGVWSACCQNGLGTVRGTLAGMACAQLASGQRSGLGADLLTQAAPKKLPPGPIARIGAAARLRWGAWRAGREV